MPVPFDPVSTSYAAVVPGSRCWYYALVARCGAPGRNQLHLAHAWYCLYGVGVAIGFRLTNLAPQRAGEGRREGGCLLYTSPSPRDRG
eukprot:1994121-Rhodomonas_salina.1